MSYEDPLAEREHALEEAFFRKYNEELRAKLRAAREREASREALAEALGVRDTQLIDALLDRGVRAESAAALALVPLVAVAWASGRVEPEERRAVLEAAHDHGVDRNSAAAALLASWLDRPPSEALLDLWERYVRDLGAELDAEHRDALRKDVLGRARAVADAAGGLLGLVARVSPEERAMLERLERAFDAA